MKLCTVTVWYNPDENCVKNILSYNSFAEKCYIVDNSVTDNSSMAKKICNAVYIPFFNNLGIAKALNVGCDLAMTDGFECCMTMDQDSYFETSSLGQYIDKVSELSDKKRVSFSPVIKPKINTTSFLGDIRRFFSPLKESELTSNESLERCITSGNIINLQVWNDVGKFNEDLFIDEVDHEFCYRLKERNYEIIKINTVTMYHQLGNARRTFLPQRCPHSGIRLYYIFRNILYVKKWHPNFSNYYDGLMRKYIFENILRLKLKNLAWMWRGYMGFKRNEIGAFTVK